MPLQGLASHRHFIKLEFLFRIRETAENALSHRIMKEVHRNSETLVWTAGLQVDVYCS